MSMSATLENAAPAATVTYVPPGESDQRTIELAKLPFVVGRADTADLHLASNRVSREHAVLTWEEDQFWIRDLGSTNGTFVNGEQIESRAVQRGDVLRIADIEVALQWNDGGYDGQDDVVSTIRSWQQMLLHRGPSCAFVPIWSLPESRIAGCMAVGVNSHTSEVSEWPAAGLRGSRVSQQMNGLMLLRAVELTAETPSDLSLLLTMDEAVDVPRWLTLLAAHKGDREVVLRLPHNTNKVESLTALIHSYGMKVARRLSRGETCQGGIDQYWLAPDLTDDLANDETRWQPLSDLIHAANDAGADVLATELADEKTAHVCAELGCKWGTGLLYGGPREACELHQ